MSLRSERQVSALRLAQQCCEFGARCRTMHLLTGLAPRELQRLFFSDVRPAPRGRAPDSPEWYHGTNLLNRAEASIFVVTYRRLRVGGFAAADALVGAYRHYRLLCQAPYRISFDRAFDLASHVDGIWATDTKALALIACPLCNCEALAAVGEVASTGERCPFCRLLQRYDFDSRLQASFPRRTTQGLADIHSNVSAILQDRVAGEGPDGDSRRNLPPLSGDGSHTSLKNGCAEPTPPDGLRIESNCLQRDGSGLSSRPRDRPP